VKGDRAPVNKFTSYGFPKSIIRTKITEKTTQEWNNELLREKTGSEILQYLKTDFINSEVAKGISEMEAGYIPDFGYKDIITFGDHQKTKSGWSVFLECFQRHPK